MLNDIAQNKNKQALGLILPLLLLAIMLVLLLREDGLRQLPGLLAQSQGGFLLLGLGAVALFLGCEALSLFLLLRPASASPRPGRCYQYALIDFYFSAITPGCCGGQPAQLCYMQRDGLPAGAAAPALLAFNSLYHAAVLIIAGLALFFFRGLPATIIPGGGLLLLYGVGAQLAIGGLYLAAIFWPELLPRLVRGLFRGLNRLGLMSNSDRRQQAVSHQLAAYRHSADYLRQHPRLLLWLLPLLILHLLALYSLPYWAYRGLGLEGLSLWQLLFTQALLTLAVESLPIPGGAGVTEGGFALLYANIFGPTLVLPALVLIRGMNYYLPLLAGGLTAAAVSRLPRQRQPLRSAAPALELLN